LYLNIPSNFELWLFECGHRSRFSSSSIVFLLCCSFSNLFSPSTRLTGRQSTVPDVRYSALQNTADSGNSDQRNSTTERSPRVVRFREEDMY